MKQWLVLGLSLGVLASCSQDKNEPNLSPKQDGDVVSISLSAEVSVEDPQLRAINYKLDKNANGKTVPMPQFEDGQLVDVHTIVKSSDGEYGVKTLKWRYDVVKKVLELAPSVKDAQGTEYSNDIQIHEFNNDNDKKWYISGLIGGTLTPNLAHVDFEGFRVLKGIDGNPGDVMGSLNVPYAFGWTELELNTKGKKDENNSYPSAKMLATANAKFQPLGALIGYRVGTAQEVNASFDPEGFNVGSNTWGDRGSFNLDTDIPSANPNKALPVWKERLCGSSVYYTFVDKPSRVAHGGLTNKIYYAWVMPHATQPAVPEVKVMLKGKSSRQPSTDYQNYTDAWFTDYTLKSAGKVDNGKVYTLSAKATRHLNLPVQYVTDYNIKGGGVLATIYDQASTTHVGSLDFATSHSNDDSGYYNGYKVTGEYHSSANPNRLSLPATIQEKWGDEYIIPRIEQWWGIFPSSMPRYEYQNRPSIHGYGIPNSPIKYGQDSEPVAVGSKDNLRRNLYSSEYSQAYVTNNDTDNAVIYAIRFQARDTKCDDYDISTDYEPVSKTYPSHLYPVARDNSMKCAYRYTRVGGKLDLDWKKEGRPEKLDNRMVIDVVYLGEEANPTSLKTISDPQWWKNKQEKGLVFTKTFPFPGMQFRSASARSQWGYYWSANRADQRYQLYTVEASSGVYGGGLRQADWYSISLRLFHNNPVATPTR